MTDIVLKDIDAILADRIRRVAEQRGWSMPKTLLHLLEQGLHSYEGDGAVRFDNSEADVLQAAIAALEQIPDATYSLIGQVESDGDRSDDR